MKRAWIAALAAIAAVSPGGCGTICNFAHGDPDIYGGVQKDVELLQTPRTATGGGVSFNKGGPVFAVLLTGDVALSLVADTLTLPLAIYMRQNEHSSEDEGGLQRTGAIGRNQPGWQLQQFPLAESRPNGQVGAAGVSLGR